MKKTRPHDLEKSRLRQIQELEKALQDPNKGTPICRAIARQSLDMLRQKPLLNLSHDL